MKNFLKSIKRVLNEPFKLSLSGQKNKTGFIIVISAIVIILSIVVILFFTRDQQTPQQTQIDREEIKRKVNEETKRFTDQLKDVEKQIEQKKTE